MSYKTELASTKAELAVAKERIKELEGADDDTSSTPGKPEKNSSNSSIPPSQESIASRELRRTKSLRKPSGKPSGGQPGHKGHTLQTIAEPDVIVKHEPVYCKCCGRLLIDIPCQKIRKTQIVDIKVVVETCEEQYYEKVCECGCVNNCEAPNCRIKYGDNLRALVTYLNVVQCIPFKRIAELISDLSGQNISEGTVQNILKENSGKADCAYEEIRKRLETASVVGADETGATVGKHLHWNWIFQNDLLTYVFQSESRGQKAIDSKFPKGLPYSTLVTDRHQSYFKMNVKDHQVCLAHLLRNAEYLNELDPNQNWSRRFIHLIEHSINLRREDNITSRKIYLLGWIKNLEKDQSTKDALEDHLIIAIYIFSDIDFLKKIANLLISCEKSDTAKTFDHVRWMREEISYAISYYREHFSAIHLNKEVIRPFIYMYVRLDFLYSSAFVDIMQKEPGKECEFENLGNWVKYPKRWEVRYRSFVRENLDKLK